MPPKTKSGYARHAGNMPNEARRHTVRVLYDSGLSIRAIAERIGVSFQAVHSLLRRSGVVLRPRGSNQGHHSRHKR
jgi:transposase